MLGPALNLTLYVDGGLLEAFPAGPNPKPNPNPNPNPKPNPKPKPKPKPNPNPNPNPNPKPKPIPKPNPNQAFLAGRVITPLVAPDVTAGGPPDARVSSIVNTAPGVRCSAESWKLAY